MRRKLISLLLSISILVGISRPVQALDYIEDEPRDFSISMSEESSTRLLSASAALPYVNSTYSDDSMQDLIANFEIPENLKQLLIGGIQLLTQNFIISDLAILNENLTRAQIFVIPDGQFDYYVQNDLEDKTGIKDFFIIFDSEKVVICFRETSYNFKCVIECLIKLSQILIKKLPSGRVVSFTVSDSPLQVAHMSEIIEKITGISGEKNLSDHFLKFLEDLLPEYKLTLNSNVDDLVEAVKNKYPNKASDISRLITAISEGDLTNDEFIKILFDIIASVNEISSDLLYDFMIIFIFYNNNPNKLIEFLNKHKDRLPINIANLCQIYQHEGKYEIGYKDGKIYILVNTQQYGGNLNISNIFILDTETYHLHSLSQEEYDSLTILSTDNLLSLIFALCYQGDSLLARKIGLLTSAMTTEVSIIADGKELLKGYLKDYFIRFGITPEGKYGFAIYNNDDELIYMSDSNLSLEFGRNSLRDISDKAILNGALNLDELKEYPKIISICRDTLDTSVQAFIVQAASDTRGR